MKKIYSSAQKDLLICSIVNIDDISSYRTDISPDEEFIQVSARKLNANIYVKPHRHRRVDRLTTITQEAWIVHRGKIKAEIFDIDNSHIEDSTIEEGGCIVLYNGGHSLTSLSENTIFYEIKTGPYFGYENDKEDI